MSSIISRGICRRPTCLQRAAFAAASRQWPRYIRLLPTDDIVRHSQFWTPTVVANNALAEANKSEPLTRGRSLLIEHGFIDQPVRRSGIYHYLPLGLRVLERIERLLDKHMRSLGASKLALSSISHESVWKRSGRLEGDFSDGDHELWGVLDRKKSGLILCPTHEEEIALTAKHFIQTSRHSLPLRLYQITRKYRDELRPRGGLLRTKEFIMKDMYSFDQTKRQAIDTYNSVRQAYNNFFTEVGIPFLVAEADSGNMGGNLSHEYHYESPLGEDTVWTCSNCDYTANDEVAIKKVEPEAPYDGAGIKLWRGISKDRTSNVTVVYPSKDNSSKDGSLKDLDIRILKEIHSDLDTSIDSLPSTAPQMRFQILIKHPKLSEQAFNELVGLETLGHSDSIVHLTNKDFLRVQDRDHCPRCDSGTLASHRTIEVGHTFFLGDRYTSPFNITIKDLASNAPARTPVQMGCYGIGVSRLLGAVAEVGAGSIQYNKKEIGALTWPRPLAPFDVVIITDKSVPESEPEAIKLYEALTKSSNRRFMALDVILDDRDQPLPYKMTDADLRGIPVVVVFGKKFARLQQVEIQCRGLKLQCHVYPGDAKRRISAAVRWLDENYQKPGPAIWPNFEPLERRIPLPRS